MRARTRRTALASLALLAGTALAGCGPSGPTLVVTSTGDDADAGLDGTCATAAGVCTLRAALAEANHRDGPDVVGFALPGDGTSTIQLRSALPPLTDDHPTTIDGYTQSGASPNTAARTSNAVLRVQVRGTGTGGIDGLLVRSAGNVVRGLSFFDFRRAVVIQGSGATGNAVVGSFLGTNAAATFAAPGIVQGTAGVEVSSSASGNRIGGTGVADRNVLSGNAHSGVMLLGTGTERNVVHGNLIGLSPSGGAAVPNGFGVDVNRGAANNEIGGDGPGEGNVVSGNRGLAVEISHEPTTTGNLVVGNFIGTNVNGTDDAAHTRNGTVGVKLEDGVAGNVVRGNVIGGNRLYGIHVTIGSTGNTIAGNQIGITAAGVDIANGGSSTSGSGAGILIDQGAAGTTIGPGNVIGRNRSAGIVLTGDAGLGNTVTETLTVGNTGMGIDLSPRNAVNPNDAGDADTGPNGRLNFPVLTAVRTGSVQGTACAGCRVELYEGSGDPTGHGEGRRFLGAVTASAGGTFSFTPSPALARGSLVTATATDAGGSTSELARNVAAT